MLGHKFNRADYLVKQKKEVKKKVQLQEDEEEDQDHHHADNRVGKFGRGVVKLGAQLLQDGTLHKAVLPKQVFDVVEETQNPLQEHLTTNETKAVASEVYKWTICKYGRVDPDVVFLKHIGSQLTRKFPHPAKREGALLI